MQVLVKQPLLIVNLVNLVILQVEHLLEIQFAPPWLVDFIQLVTDHLKTRFLTLQFQVIFHHSG